LTQHASKVALYPLAVFIVNTDEVQPWLTASQGPAHGAIFIGSQLILFDWGKTIGGLAPPMFRGVDRLRFRFMLTMVSYNLIRIPKPLAVAILDVLHTGAMSLLSSSPKWAVGKGKGTSTQ
jgi:hypothetical protein